MNRREAIKITTLFGLSAFAIPKIDALNKSKTQFHFIGLGSAGSNMVKYFHSKGLKGKFTCISIPSGDYSDDIQFIPIIPPPVQTRFSRIKGFHGLSDRYREHPIPEVVEKLFKNDEKFILLAGLGGNTGSFLSFKLSEMLRNNKNDFFLLNTLPFRFEGRPKGVKAKYISDKLPSNCLTCDLERMRKEFGNMTILEAFQKGDNKVYKLFIENIL